MDDRGGDDLLTIPEAAERLKVSGVTVSRWIKQGRLRAMKVGPRAVRIRSADLDLVLAPAMAAPVPPQPLENRETNAGDRFSGGTGWAAPAVNGSRDDRLAVAGEALLLREKVLARRKGVPLATDDDGPGSGKKRRKG